MIINSYIYRANDQKTITCRIKHFQTHKSFMQFQCDNIWRRVDQLDFRFGDELTSHPRGRDDQGDELTCNRIGIASGSGFRTVTLLLRLTIYLRIRIRYSMSLTPD